MAAADIGARALLAIQVEDVDAVISELEQHDVKLINGPMVQP